MCICIYNMSIHSSICNATKVSYKNSGENIAGNSSNSGAVNAWRNSSGYNYTGIGVVHSSKYGKVYGRCL